MTESPPVLEARHIVKTFPGVRALDGVDLCVNRAEVHALVGENGAGKSTLIHVLAGIYQPDSGEILMHGRPVRFENPRRAARAGIGVVFQELSLVPNLSVAENIFFNRQPTRRGGIIDGARLRAQTRNILRLFNLDLSPNALVKDLPLAMRQVVEILKALSLEPSVLILDEPTSSLSAAETQLLFRNVIELKLCGIAVLFISHHLPDIFQVADRVTVLRDGRHVATRNIETVDEDDIVKLMVGRELDRTYGARTTPIGPEALRLEKGSRGRAFRDVSLSVRAGEIVGLAGLVGSGRTELGRALCGIEPLQSGELYLAGAAVTIGSARQAIRHGLAYLTEDRKEQGLFLSKSIAENCIAPNLAEFSRPLGFLHSRAIAEFAEQCRRRYNIAAPSVRKVVQTLSGGNQQKVLLSMWMGVRPKVLIADEPTRGVDVGAKTEIYRLLRELAAQGVGVILISSDLLEVIGMSDRVLVMCAGRIAGEFSGKGATEENIMAAATGVRAHAG
ncbi:sugar ABC transporter ATP-binding protein [bacterium]|nr:sugar ABC transporter ATP-binding protein [bacterium]